uniref:Uncharacterized protein n=2 Tax=Magallana gigas TaxID=29159 RepID=A0A8W8IH27_MAGGI
MNKRIEMKRSHTVVLILFAILTLGIALTLLLTDHSRNKNNTAGAAPLSSPDAPARWTNPCNATRNFSLGDFTFPDVSEFEKIQRIEEKLLAAKDIANNLQTKMSEERIRSPSLEVYVESHHIENFPQTTITDQDLEIYKKNVTLAYVRTYRELSVVAAFLEAIRKDEVTFEHGSWLSTFSENEEHIYRLLCEVHNAIIISGATIEYESRDIVPESMRNMFDRTMRYMRDYIILRDSVKLLQSFLDMNEVILSSLSNSS